MTEKNEQVLANFVFDWYFHSKFLWEQFMPGIPWNASSSYDMIKFGKKINVVLLEIEKKIEQIFSKIEGVRFFVNIHKKYGHSNIIVVRMGVSTDE